MAMMSDEKRMIPINEIARRLAVPRYFLGKIMNKVVKKDILNSVKGPNGGFLLSKTTLDTSLLALLETMDGLEQFDCCVLRLRKCNAEYPCPLHKQLGSYKKDFLELFSNTSVGSLLKEDKLEFIRSIAAR